MALQCWRDETMNNPLVLFTDNEGAFGSLIASKRSHKVGELIVNLASFNLKMFFALEHGLKE